MDVFKSLSEGASYSEPTLQLILGAWVLGTLFEGKQKVDVVTGDVSEDDYDKQSIYSLLYSLYRTVGQTRSETGERYEFTFNTWGYAWPEAWGEGPISATDPQRFGKNAYSGLFHFREVAAHVAERAGKVHVIELGCGTGAGAHHVCKNILPDCTYEAVDMQRAAIETCNRKFVPELGGRLKATHADATRLSTPDGRADVIAVCETHVTEYAGRVTDEDRAFFQTAKRLLAPGGYLTWGNAIPDSTWQPCFDYLESIGMTRVDSVDVTAEAVAARDQDKPRIELYLDQCIDKFFGFRIPVLGAMKRQQARVAMANFARHPGTQLYKNMVDRTDTYRVSLFRKTG
ncbi:MAG: class I SAM-dependent methyltransferase [Polyangiaceae bacterium]